MKKIAIRGHSSPFDNNQVDKLILENGFGNNTGNMVFLESIMRTLYTHECEIEVVRVQKQDIETLARQMNEKYDCFVIPLANAFRISFRSELIKLTKLIQLLKMPCILVGVGLQTGVTEDGKRSFSFDEEAKAFVKALLEKSAKIGIRGEITANYLTHLGFHRGRDFEVIGCPSMFYYGNKLPSIKKDSWSDDVRISICTKGDRDPFFLEYFWDIYQNYSDTYYVMQSLEDLLFMYYGKPLGHKRYQLSSHAYPCSLVSKPYMDRHVVAFASVKAWREFLEERTVSIGTRIHGSIMALLSGTPAILCAHDARVLELARYHEIPYYFKEQIEGKSIRQVYEMTGFDRLQQGQQERFDRYLMFLHENGLETIYDEEKESKFDEKIRLCNGINTIQPFIDVDVAEQERRLRELHEYYENRIERVKGEKSQQSRLDRLWSRLKFCDTLLRSGVKK